MKFSKLSAILATSTALAAPIVITVKEIVYIDGTLTYTSTSSPLTRPTPTPTPVFNDSVETDTPNAVLGPNGAVGIPITGDNDDANLLLYTSETQAPETTLSNEAQPVVTTTLEPSSPSTTSSSTTVQQEETSTPESNNNNNDNNDSFSSSMTNIHNEKRSLHVDTNDLTWSEELAAYAQNYADQYDCSGNLIHSGGPYGENLALGYGLTGAVDAWYDEISKYNYADPGYSPQTGHFTQVVWKSSTLVGCGYKYCGSYWGDYVVCEYAPPGNVIGRFAENVMPLK